MLIRSKQVLINAVGQILLDGYLVEPDSISEIIATLSKDFFWNNSVNLVAYEVRWDDKTNNDLKAQVFKSVLQGYLKAADAISIEEFDKKLCELDNEMLNELKRKFRFALLIEMKFPPAPPLRPGY